MNFSTNMTNVQVFLSDLIFFHSNEMCISAILSTLSLFGKLLCYIFYDISNMSMPKIKFIPFVIKSQVSVIYVPTFILNCITSNFFSMMSDMVNLQQVHDFTKVTVLLQCQFMKLQLGTFFGSVFDIPQHISSLLEIQEQVFLFSGFISRQY